MPGMIGPSAYKPFDEYRVTYAITNPNGKDYARIDFLAGGTRVGQIVFGDSIKPGAYAAFSNDQIWLYFPLSHFENICQLLRHEKDLALYVEPELPPSPIPGPPGRIGRGGITNAPPNVY